MEFEMKLYKQHIKRIKLNLGALYDPSDPNKIKLWNETMYTLSCLEQDLKEYKRVNGL